LRHRRYRIAKTTIAPAAKLLLDRYRFQLIADAGPLKAFQLTRK
jgi:hypothetical protein